ncbi:MAG TPA: AMP-binding protein [Candidatus Binataceae bacterium]|nr:AMP-binding protein [Candidatus Binataceae bacterium]
MTFVEDILMRLEQAGKAPVMREARDGRLVATTAAELVVMVKRARGFLAGCGLNPGDRCVLLAPNSVRWAALDIAMMAEGLVTVPLYARQAPAELVGMMKDSMPSLIVCDPSLVSAIRNAWTGGPPVVSVEEAFQVRIGTPAPPVHHADHDTVTIIYTSGTSGEPKGVVLNAGNVNHMLWCTNSRLDQLMGTSAGPDRIFHYLPVCFAGSWILMLTALTRSSVLTLSTDLNKLADELKLAQPDYFLNVPTLLERVRTRVEETIAKRGIANRIFVRAKREYLRREAGRSQRLDSFYLWIANTLLFPKIRKSIGGPNLRALICGSAPLAVETQMFFMMLGIPVLQVYGLTETTAICTMDDPRHFAPGRVGPAIPGIEMTLGQNSEILVKGPNIFPGYWRRPEETAKVLAGGWFHTGDQGDVDESGNWRITGRIKNLIILNSGHNIAPEPIEEAIAARLPEAQHVMLLGNQRSFLAAIVTSTGTNGASNGLRRERVQTALDALNTRLPHYKQIRAFYIAMEPFTIESGLLTANGKLKRDVIAARFSAEIECLYQKRPA